MPDETSLKTAAIRRKRAAPAPAPAKEPPVPVPSIPAEDEVAVEDVFERVVRPKLLWCTAGLEKLGVQEEDLAHPYGCGALGCVYGTRTANVVVKATCQDGEAQLSELLREWRARSPKSYPSALPAIHAVRQLKCKGGPRAFKTRTRAAIGQGRHTDVVDICSGRVYAIQREDILDVHFPKGVSSDVVRRLLEEFVDTLDEDPAREYLAEVVRDAGAMDRGERAAVLTFFPTFLDQVLVALRALRDRGVVLYDLHWGNFGLRAGTGAGTAHAAEYVIRDIGAFHAEDPQTLQEMEISKLGAFRPVPPGLGLGDLAVGSETQVLQARGLEGIPVGTARPPRAGKRRA